MQGLLINIFVFLGAICFKIQYILTFPDYEPVCEEF